MTSLDGFYAERPEADRLLQGLGRLELVRTRELLSEALPAPPAVIGDVGGGTGPYAGWLAANGYEVHKIDPVERHVAWAARDHPTLASVQVGDARRLPWSARSCDAVLLMGPLYHLTERQDRLQALREAGRVLREGGTLFAVVIPRWASALVGMERGWIYDDDYAAMVRQELATGRHRRPDRWPRLFMDGFFHDLVDLQSEIEAAGFALERCAAIEGPARLSRDFDDAWQDAAKRERILQLSRAAEGVPELLAASPHVAVIARRA
jgi:SAM-dependent methyltransferase